MEIITKAKKSCTAYENPYPRKPEGDVLPKGAAVRLERIIHLPKGTVPGCEIGALWEEGTIRYYCIDLLWGQEALSGAAVCAGEMDGIQSILASTSLALEPLSVIRLYSYRFRSNAPSGS